MILCTTGIQPMDEDDTLKGNVLADIKALYE